jgi:hypothetical protein
MSTNDNNSNLVLWDGPGWYARSAGSLQVRKVPFGNPDAYTDAAGWAKHYGMADLLGWFEDEADCKSEAVRQLVTHEHPDLILQKYDRALTSLLQSFAWYGGDFEQALGRLLGQADEANRRKIYRTWPAILAKHYTFADEAHGREAREKRDGHWNARVTDCETVEEFLRRYYKPEDYGGDEGGFRSLLGFFEEAYEMNGHIFIQAQYSTTGSIVSFWGER